jgi:hypothetical protein
LGLALFELSNPERCLLRGDDWLFAPEEDFERKGDVANVVFPSGYTPNLGRPINLYYGAETCIALATASVRSLLVGGSATAGLSPREIFPNRWSSIQGAIQSLFESLIRFSLKFCQILLDEVESNDAELKILRKSAKQRCFFFVFELIE